MGSAGNALGSFFSGGSGSDSGGFQQGNQDAINQAFSRNQMLGDNGLQRDIAAYGRGEGTLANAIGSYSGPGQQNQAYRQLALDPTSSLRFATDQIQNNPLMAQTFGKDGTLSRTTNEEKDLSQRGYSLKPEDYEAYGQASGNIARMFGGAQQGLAQSLSDRGLGTSGIGNQAFMSNQGSQLEQLGQLQSQIAQQRMNMNMQRLGQTRQFLGQLTGQAQGAVQNQFGRELAGVQNQQDQLNNGGVARQGQMDQQANQRFNQQQATKPVTFGDALASLGYSGLGGVSSMFGGKTNSGKQANTSGNGQYSSLGNQSDNSGSDSGDGSNSPIKAVTSMFA